jgi:expansin (peptidoglycan-binding protein)
MQLVTNNNLIQTDFTVKTEWDRGFTGKLEIFNPGEAIKDWTIEFESPFEIYADAIWGAEIVSHDGDRYVLKPVDYNETIGSQKTIAISFNANKVNGQIINPSNIFLLDENNSNFDTPVVDNFPKENAIDSDTVTTTDNNLPAEVDFTLIKDWGSGFEGKISITNNSGSNIDSWSLAFDFPNPINNIWDAEIDNYDNQSYVVSNAPWNREIAAGETLTFGFTGDNSVTLEPQNFTLNGSTFNSPSTSDSIYTFFNPNLDPELEINQNYQGRATFYDAANPAGGKGASGYDVPVQTELEKVVAINNVQWNGSEASGAFLAVSGPKQREGAAPIIVQVVDYLYERADGLDMSGEAFAKVADPVDGVVNIDYQLVGPADDYVTAYGYSIGQGIVVEGIAETNPYYAAVRLNNHRYPIESVDLITDEGSQVNLDRESDNRFVLNSNYPLEGGQDLLVTDIFGQQVTLNDVNITNGSSADIVTGEQFAMI